jgi:hypothetical protein
MMDSPCVEFVGEGAVVASWQAARVARATAERRDLSNRDLQKAVAIKIIAIGIHIGN